MMKYFQNFQRNILMCSLKIYLLFSEFLWAFAIYGSRNWYKSEKFFSPIFPLIETFNYREEASVRFEENKNGVLELFATEDIEKGEEIIICEGKLRNKDLLENYGFVLEKNEHNSLDVGVGLEEGEQLYGNKKELFHEIGFKNGQTFPLSEEKIPEDLLVALRIYHTTVYDLEDVRNALENKPVSMQNELKVAETLLELCTSSLKSFKTTAKQDKELLKTSLTTRMRNAVIYRRGEKKILLKTLERARVAFDGVKSKWDMRTMDIPGTKEFRATVRGSEIL